MGTYYQIACDDCRVYIGLGKRLGKTGRFQGVYFGSVGRWDDGKRAWDAVQDFLAQHEGHALSFTNDGEKDLEGYREVEPDWDKVGSD